MTSWVPRRVFDAMNRGLRGQPGAVVHVEARLPTRCTEMGQVIRRQVVEAPRQARRQIYERALERAQRSMA